MYNIEDLFLFSKGRLSWKNQIKYLISNMIKSMTCWGHKSHKDLKKGYGYACYLNIFFRSPKLTSDVQFLFWLRWASICVAADNLWRLGQKSKLHIPSYLCMYRSPEKITWGHFTNFYGHIHLLASGSIFFRELWWCIVSFLPKNHLKSGLSINQLSFLQIYFSIKKKNVLEFGKLYVLIQLR